MIWKQIRTLILHKWFILAAGRRLGVPLWNLLVHDLSKLLPRELLPYARWFHGAGDNPMPFAYAWLHHQNHNPHHWEYWIVRTGHSSQTHTHKTGCYPMPETYVREMVADWWSASRTKKGTWDMRPWLAVNFPVMELHRDTRNLARQIIWNLSF